MKLPSATIRVRIVILGGVEVRAPGEELRDRGRGLSTSASEERVDDAGEEDRGESSRSRGWNGL